MEEHPVDMERLNEVFSDERIRESLSGIGINDPYDVFALFLSGDKDLRRFLGNAKVNTDERPILEFSLPKSLYRSVNGAERVQELLNSAEEILPPVNLNGLEPADFYLNVGKSFNRYNFRLNQALKAFEESLERDPEQREAAVYADNLKKELGK